ncbi:hypothetical protein V8F06_005059 [Rhypophila decipiens]
MSSSYSDCVASLRTSLSFLESSVNTLGNGVEDFPRLSSVLKTVRHYELIPQPTLAAAEASLRDEIGPFVAQLLDRADKQLERHARRVETLKARAELNAGRLSHIPRDRDGNYEDSGKSSRWGNKNAAAASRATSSNRPLQGEAALRAKVVHQRKEALKYSIERLELEVQQKERELRLRLEQKS